MRRILLLVLAVLSLAAGSALAQDRRIRLATTTSTDNSGLLAALDPAFETATGYRVDVIAVGTGKALALGRNGDVDVVLVHARAAEDRFVSDGYGVNRREVMHNDFILVGPAADPAALKSLRSAADALAVLARRQFPFVSRGDNSGTHLKELELWSRVQLEPRGNWYKEAGQGMGAVLTMTDALQGYTLTDRGTYLSMKDRVGLVMVLEGDPLLHNPYGAIAVNPALHPHVNYTGAMAYIDWLTSTEGQALIGAFAVGGEPLFHPDAIPGAVR